MPMTRMRYHFVTGTEDRRPLIAPDLEEDVYETIREAAVQAGGRILEIGGIEDHVHLLAALHPDVAPSAFIGEVKGRTSRQLAAEHPELEGFAWQEGYGGFTLSPVELGRIRSYIQNHTAHHENETTWDRFERISE